MKGKIIPLPRPQWPPPWIWALGPFAIIVLFFGALFGFAWTAPPQPKPPKPPCIAFCQDRHPLPRHGVPMS